MRIPNPLKYHYALLVLVMLISLSPLVLAQLSKSYDAGSKTISSDYGTVRLVHNTDFCLGKDACSASLEIKPSYDIDSAILGKEFRGTDNKLRSIENSLNVYYWVEQQFPKTVKDYGICHYIDKVNATPINYDYQCEKGSHVEYYTKQVKESKGISETMYAGQTYYLELKGSLYKEDKAVDWILELNNFGKLTEFAWWNTSTLYQRNATINHTVVIPTGGYMNISALVNGTYGFDIGQCSSPSIIWFNTQRFKPASTNTSYSLYYNNNSDFYAVNVSDDGELPHEVESGCGVSYMPYDVWDGNLTFVGHNVSRDSTSNQHAVTLSPIGAATQVETPGIIGKALNFSNSDTTDNNNVTIKNMLPMACWAISFWYKTPTPAKQQQLFADDATFILGIYTSKMYFGHIADGPDLTGGTTITANLWHYMTFTQCKGGEKTMYLDGVSQGANKDTTNDDWIGRVIMNERIGLPNLPIFGDIDDLRVYSRNISLQEHQVEYQMARNNISAPLGIEAVNVSISEAGYVHVNTNWTNLPYYTNSSINFTISAIGNTSSYNVSVNISNSSVQYILYTVNDLANNTPWSNRSITLQHSGENWTLFANSSYAGQQNSSLVRIANPLNISLEAPFNRTNTTDTTPDFIFNLTDFDDGANASCRLYVNGTEVGNNPQSMSGKNTTITSSVLDDRYNQPWFVNCTDGSDTVTSETRIIGIESIMLHVCDNVYTVPFINFTFKNEETLIPINASADSTSWAYWLSSADASSNKTYLFSNTTANPSYAFCFSPGYESIRANLDFQFSSVGYPQRRYSFSNTPLTNTTTNTTLYLLATADGIYSSYQVQDTTGSPISGVLVQVERQFSGAWTLIQQDTTDSSGMVTFWINPDYDHRLTFTKTGYTSITVTIRPTQSTYTVKMSRSTGVVEYDAPLEGIRWFITPAVGRLDRNATYTFGFNVTANQSNLASCKIELVNSSLSILNSTTGCATTGGYIYVDHYTSDTPKLWGRYYLDIGGGYLLVDGDAYWVIENINATNATFIKVFQRLKDLAEFGEGNKQEFSRITLFFFVVFLILASLSMFTGWDTIWPGAAGFVVWGIVTIASIAGFFTLDNLTNYNWVNQYYLWLMATMISGGYLANYWAKD